jgi:acyl-coenzyme A synthetase/AMP-(fatty) acid ligase
MTVEFIRFHAQVTPDSIAVRNGTTAISYARLAHELAQLVRALEVYEISPGTVVALGCHNSYWQLKLLLALESLGAVRAPFPLPLEAGTLRLVAAADLIVTDCVVADLPVARHILLAPDWWQAVAAGEPSPAWAPALRDPEGPDLILMTSGTTGAAKRILLSRRALAGRNHERVWQYRLTQGSAFLVTTALSVGVVLTTVLACLELGATVVFDPEALVLGRLDAISHVVLLPVHLRRLIAALPSRHTKPMNLFVVSIGAPLVDPLRSQVLGKLASDLFDSYGSNEVGPICALDAQGKGAILPGVEVRIEDETARILPAGQAGLVAARGPWMCGGYLDDPTASAQKFARGWFYPGDVGVLDEQGRLQIRGRADELLNVGGLKLSPVLLEEMLARSLRGVDVGVCAVTGDAGTLELCVALAGSKEGDAELARIVSSVLGQEFGQICVVRVDAVPRTAAGKIRRAALQEAIAPLVRSGRKSPRSPAGPVVGDPDR